MVPSPITYVRHAMAVPAQGVHPTAWHLDEQGRADAARLAERLEVAPRVGTLVTSTEPKALETAESIATRWGTALVVDERLREAIRPWIGPGYRAVAHRYLRGELPDGWEPHAEVAGRVRSAVAAATAAAAGGPVVVVSHGLALALHLGERLGEAFDREHFWSYLAFPDAWALDAAGTLHRPVLSADAI
ncbi:MAG: histidine phosphatase family protein [Acidimicrobiales bacterium]